MTNRAIAWCVMWYLWKPKIKWTRHPFVKETFAYMCFFLNEISSSLVFPNPLTVRWWDSALPAPSERNFHLIPKWNQREKWCEQSPKHRAAANHRDSRNSLHNPIPKGLCVRICMCVWPSKDTRHAGNQAVSQIHYHTRPTLWRLNNWRQGKVIAEKENTALIYGH